jgi:ATP-dependent Zn protease
MVMSEENKRLTAYHEAGHSIVGRLVPEQDSLHKVIIILRGRALGVTLFLPEQYRFSANKRSAGESDHHAVRRPAGRGDHLILGRQTRASTR